MDDLAVRGVHRLEHDLSALCLHLFGESGGVDPQRLAAPLGVAVDVEANLRSRHGLTLDDGAAQFEHPLEDAPFRAHQRLGLLSNHIHVDGVVVDAVADLAFEAEGSKQAHEKALEVGRLIGNWDVFPIVVVPRWARSPFPGLRPFRGPGRAASRGGRASAARAGGRAGT